MAQFGVAVLLLVYRMDLVQEVCNSLSIPEAVIGNERLAQWRLKAIEPNRKTESHCIG